MMRSTHVAGCLVLTLALVGCTLDSSGLFDGTTGAIDGAGGTGSGGATTSQSTTANSTTSSTTATSTTTGSGGAGGTGGATTGTGGIGGATTTGAGGTGGTGGTGGATTGTGGAGGATTGTGGTGGTGGATTGTGGTGGTTTTAVGTCAPGLACEAELPPGWTYVDFSANAADACASGFASSAAVSELPPSAGACACSCGGPGSSPCATLTVQFNEKDKSGCGGLSVTMTSDGACHAIPNNTALGKGSRSAIANLGAAKVACPATDTKPPAAFSGRACGLVAISSACAGGPGVCVPEAVGPRCVEKAGAEAACPAGYGTPHVVYQPSDMSDQRSCGCQCESDAVTCSGAKVDLYADEGWCNNPSGSAAPVPTSNTCTPFNIPSWDRSAYKSAPLTPDKKTCSPKDPAPTVSGAVLVDPTKARTLCCAP